MFVVYEGTEQEFWAKLRNEIRQEITRAESKRLVPIEKKEACRLLGITYPTLKNIMNKEGMNIIYASDIERLNLKYPKYNKSNVNI